MAVTTSKLKCLKLCFKKKCPLTPSPFKKKKSGKNQRKLAKDNTGTLAHISTYDAILSYTCSTLYKYLNLKCFLWKKKSCAYLYSKYYYNWKKKQIIDNGNNSHSKHKINIKLTIRQKSLFNTHVEYALHRHSSDI